MSRVQGLGWGIRLLALTVGGSVSVMAIAFLVVATPRPRSVEAIASNPIENNPNANLDSGPSSPLEATLSSAVHPLPQDTPQPSPVPVSGSPIPDTQPFPPAQQVTSQQHLSPGRWSSPLPLTSTPELDPEPNAEPGLDLKLELGLEPERGAIAQSSPSSPLPLVSPSTSSLTPAPSLPLKLQDVVILALENNRTIKNAYLDRIIDREVLAVAEDRFNPDVTPRMQLGLERDDQGLSTATGFDVQLEAEMDVRLPTGTRFSVAWQTDGLVEGTIGSNAGSNNRVGQNVSITVTQPLWRNAGQAINRAPINLARLQDEQARFNLQSILIATITTAIQRYYDLVLAQQQLEIQKAVLERAEEELTRIIALIEAGRLPAVQQIEAEANVANRQVDVLDAENDLRSTQLNLIQALDIEQTLVPEATDMAGLVASEIQFADDDTLVEYALLHNPDYRADLLDLDIAAIRLLQAENNLRWDLDMVLTYINTLDNQAAERSDVRAGIQLSRELGDRTLKQQVIEQHTRIRQLENTRIEDKENLEISIRNALRDVAFQQTQVEQAQRATQLAQQQLQNTQEQLRQGRGTTFFDVIQAQDDLVDAQNRELNAQIGYQNALVNLDQQLGHTLETWNIQIRPVVEAGSDSGAL
ncbi:MAG: TolC family protein [Cyanothece sp. SIO2G6]|nr:TolC family protein [Cyanothece sp. SIO2G6]